MEENKYQLMLASWEEQDRLKVGKNWFKRRKKQTKSKTIQAQSIQRIKI